MCQFPPPLEPPNQKIGQCRNLLKILAIGQLMLAVLALLAADYFNILYDLMMVFLLYMGWTTFNWCTVLVFFLCCAINSVQFIIILIGMIQHSQLFDTKHIADSIYILACIFYYPTALFLSHYAYKHFKNLNLDGTANIDMFGGNNNGGGQQIRQNQQGDYHRIQETNDGVRNTPSLQQKNKQKNDGPFKGKGVRIG